VQSGDYIPSMGYILIREVPFKEMCGMYDDNCLEYDMDDLWDAYQERGTPWRAMTKTGETTIVWPNHIDDTELVSIESR